MVTVKEGLAEAVAVIAFIEITFLICYQIYLWRKRKSQSQVSNVAAAVRRAGPEIGDLSSLSNMAVPKASVRWIPSNVEVIPPVPNTVLCRRRIAARDPRVTCSDDQPEPEPTIANEHVQFISYRPFGLPEAFFDE